MSLIRRQLSGTFITSAGLMGVNFVTGVIVARLLSSSGRGEIAAVTAWASMLSWAAALGFNEAVTYLMSSRPKDGPRIFGTAIVFSLIAGTVGIVIAELLLPRAFAAQRPAVLHYAQWFMFGLPLGVLGGSLSGLISGNQDFRAMNFLRMLNPLTYSVALLILWLFHELTVPSVLIATFICGLVTFVWTFYIVARQIPVGRPSLALLREGFGYGLKMQGYLLGTLGNSRLDVMLMPAILSAANIGCYSVATNVSGLIGNLLGSLCLVVFPAAARAGNKEGLLLVAKTLRLVLIGGTIMAVCLFCAAPFLLRVVYGASFTEGVLPLRILLPGAVLISGAGILSSGLQAANRPAMASYAQLAGLVVTLLGLSVLLKPLGIVGAALTSTFSYAVTFVVALFALARIPEFNIGNAISVRAFAKELQSLLGRMRRTSLGIENA